jgi:hypothetical protein
METSKTLIKDLQQYEPYKHMTEYAIRKTIGEQYDMKRARNVELMVTLESLQKVPNIQHNITLPNDALIEVLMHADYDTINSFITVKKDLDIVNNQIIWSTLARRQRLPKFIPVTNKKTFDKLKTAVLKAKEAFLIHKKSPIFTISDKHKEITLFWCKLYDVTKCKDHQIEVEHMKTSGNFILSYGKHNKPITIKQFRLLLVQLFYNFPTLKVTGI